MWSLQLLRVKVPQYVSANEYEPGTKTRNILMHQVTGQRTQTTREGVTYVNVTSYVSCMWRHVYNFQNYKVMP